MWIYLNPNFNLRIHGFCIYVYVSVLTTKIGKNQCSFKVALLLSTVVATGLESKVCVRATIGLFECISESNFGSPFAYV